MPERSALTSVGEKNGNAGDRFGRLRYREIARYRFRRYERVNSKSELYRNAAAIIAEANGSSVVSTAAARR
jgi:hypothetical protein